MNDRRGLGSGPRQGGAAPLPAGGVVLAGAALLAAGVALLAHAGSSEAAIDARAAEAERTALAVSASGPPLSVTGSDGREYIEYDLLLTNALGAPVTLRSIEVLDGRGRRLLRLEGDALADVTHDLLRSPPTGTVAASGTVATMVEVVVGKRDRPRRLTHRIRYQVPADAPALNEIGSLVVRGPSLRIPAGGPVVIAPPLRGAGWLGINACCEPSGHREALFAANGRFVKPETFAVDWLRLRRGRLYAGDGSQVSHWFGEGAPLLAVADGIVVRAVDGRPEIQPAPFGTPIVRTPDEFDGNYVVIRLRPRVFAFYAHIRPGTVRVRVGQRVRTGQRLGELGNTGQTTAPHLHLSIQDGPDPGTSNSLPFEIDRYRVAGSGQLVPAGTEGAVDARVRITRTPSSQQRTYPLTGALVHFRNTP